MPSDHSPDWHARRAKAIGSSEIAALYGVQEPYQMGLFALWHFKAGNIPAPEVKGPRIDWGNRLEAIIAEWAAHENGWEISQGHHVVDPTTPGLGCTVDRNIAAPGENDENCDGPGVLECKNVDWMIHRSKWRGGEPPISIILQHQHQMAATGRTWGAVVALKGGNELLVYRYEARPALIADIRKRVTAFWRSIEEGKPPAIDGSDSAFHALRELHPDPVDEAIDLTGDNAFPVLCAELHSATEARKDAVRHEDHLKAQVMEKLGDHRRAWCDDWSASLVMTKANPGKVITPEMVGEVIGARAESRRLNVKERVVA